MKLLTRENYSKGFLVDDEVIGGVTEMAPEPGQAKVFSAYVSHYLTGETYLYQEFDNLDAALDHLATVERQWRYEAIGCGSKKSGSGGGCSTGGCGTSATSSSTGCGAGSCGTGGCR